MVWATLGFLRAIKKVTEFSHGGLFQMKTDELITIPEYCAVCRHKLSGTEFMCPKCGHCVVC